MLTKQDIETLRASIRPMFEASLSAIRSAAATRANLSRAHYSRATGREFSEAEVAFGTMNRITDLGECRRLMAGGPRASYARDSAPGRPPYGAIGTDEAELRSIERYGQDHALSNADAFRDYLAGKVV
jgi:hypothetical protein